MDHYPTFFPRQAMRASATTDGGVGFATVSLFNDSKAGMFLIVRDVTFNTGANSGITFGNIQGRLTGTNVTAKPFMITQPAVPGLFDWSDQGSQTAGDYGEAAQASAATFWPHDFPIAVVEPNTSFFIQNNITTQALRAGFIWEAVFADQLAPYYKPPT